MFTDSHKHKAMGVINRYTIGEYQFREASAIFQTPAAADSRDIDSSKAASFDQNTCCKAVKDNTQERSTTDGGFT